MLFPTEAQKRDLAWIWHRGDRAFFQAGACHILVDVFLRRCPAAGFRPLMVRPDAGFRGSHIVAASPTTVFDWHGFSDRERFLAHYFRKLRQFYPGWNATVFELDDFMTPSFFQKYSHRAPTHYFRNPTRRAEAFVSRLLLRQPNPALAIPA